jgi:hypothetical protein
MNIETGKSAKRKGATRPRDARKVDGVKPTVGLGNTIGLKNYGYSYEWRYFVRHGWRIRVRWFKTERARDQAFDNFCGVKWNTAYYRNAKKVNK